MASRISRMIHRAEQRAQQRRAIEDVADPELKAALKGLGEAITQKSEPAAPVKPHVNVANQDSDEPWWMK